MNLTGVVVFLPGGAGGEGPALLEPLLLAPGAVWLAEAFRRCGVSSFLVVCREEDQERCAHCFPQDTVFITDGVPDADKRLEAFLAEREGRVAVITGAALLSEEGVRRLGGEGPLPAGVSTGIYRVDAAALRPSLRAGSGFQEVLRTEGEAFGGEGGLNEVLPLRASAEGPQAVWAAARRLQSRRLAEAGVCILDAESVYVDPTVTVGAGSVLLPGAILRGRTVIGKNCEIGPNCMVRDCAVGDGVTINASQCNESVIGDHAKIGPFAYIRPGCTVGADTKVGDFVEVKNSVIGDGTKISHLTYVGDSDVGKNVNLGCGTVTVNYDGNAKFRTVVGDNAFVGCNSNLIAPVRIGTSAYVAAGSTVTDDVPADGLAIARAPQTIKTQWAARRKKK